MRIQLDNGFIEYRQGTGGNIEITQIRAYEKGKGTGKELIEKLIDKENPYHSIYAFVLGSRTGAISFYEKCGFKKIELGKSIYKNDDTILMWRS